VKGLALWVLLLVIACPVAAMGGQVEKAMKGLEEERLEAVRAREAATHRIAAERKALKAKISSLREEIHRLKGEIEGLKATFSASERQLEDLHRQQSDLEQQIKELEGTVRGAAKDLEALFRHSLTSPEVPDRFERLERLLDERRFPGFEDIKALVELAFEEMELSGRIVKRKGAFISPEGELVQGEILRLGKFTAYWRRDGEVGPLVYGKENRQLFALAGRLPWWVRWNVKHYMDGKAEAVYLDPSGGAALKYVVRRPGLYEHLRSGGPIVIPILLIALAAFFIVLERSLFFLRRIRSPRVVFDRALELAREGRWQECQELLQGQGNHPTARVMLALLRERGNPREVLEAALEEALLKEQMRLSHLLPGLRVLGTVAPLLGLLGTVVGIISTFRSITLYGTGDPRMMAGGISEALVTTEVGLAVAIPVMLLYSFFDSRAERLSVEMEERAVALMGFLEAAE